MAHVQKSAHDRLKDILKHTVLQPGTIAQLQTLIHSLDLGFGLFAHSQTIACGV